MLQTLQIHLQILISILSPQSLGDHLLMLDLSLPSQHPQHPLRRLIIQIRILSHHIDHIHEPSALFMVLVPEIQLVIEAVDIVDDDAKSAVAVVDGTQGGEGQG